MSETLRSVVRVTVITIMGFPEIIKDFLCFSLFDRVDMFVWVIYLAQVSEGIVDFLYSSLGKEKPYVVKWETENLSKVSKSNVKARYCDSSEP